jgi:hypothetical protein
MDVEIQQPQEVGKSRIVKVDKEEAWELFTSQASNEGRAVRRFIHSPFLPSSSPQYPPLIWLSWPNFLPSC